MRGKSLVSTLLVLLSICLCAPGWCTPQYFVDSDGNYLGSFDGTTPPEGAIEVPSPPPVAGCFWLGSEWSPAPPSISSSVVGLPIEPGNDGNILVSHTTNNRSALFINGSGALSATSPDTLPMAGTVYAQFLLKVITPPTEGNAYGLICKKNAGDAFVYLLEIVPGSSSGYRLKYSFYDGTNIQSTTSPVDIPAKHWIAITVCTVPAYHLLGHIPGSPYRPVAGGGNNSMDVTFVVNGIASDVTTLPGLPTDNPDSLFTVGAVGLNELCDTVYVKELRLWGVGTLIDPTEMAATYVQAGSIGLIAYWRFDDVIDAGIRYLWDYSGNGHDLRKYLQENQFPNLSDDVPEWFYVPVVTQLKLNPLLHINGGQLVEAIHPDVPWRIEDGGTGVTELSAIEGTANQIGVEGTGQIIGGNLTLSLPQDINTTSSPTFAGLTLTNPLGVSSGGTGQQTLSNITGTTNQVSVSGGTGAVAGTGVTLSLPQDIHTGATPTFAGINITEGSNARMGVATLVNGTVTVSTTAVHTNSRIFLQVIGTPNQHNVTPGNIVNETGFDIGSSDSADGRQVFWFIIN